jgi:hypothetical protein
MICDLQHDPLMTLETSARAGVDQAFNRIKSPVVHEIALSCKKNEGMLTIMLSVKVNVWGGLCRGTP